MANDSSSSDQLSTSPERAAASQDALEVDSRDAHESSFGAAQTVPNQQLTPAERKAKKELKQKLKFEMRRRKYQMRHDQAVTRNDPTVAAQALQDLERLIQRERERAMAASTGNLDNTQQSQESTAVLIQDNALFRPQNHPREVEARAIVESVYHALQRVFKKLDAVEKEQTDDEEQKVVQTLQARALLKNMTRGTQDLDMFNDPSALRGYTRQKFTERAFLVVSSLCQLEQRAKEILLDTQETTQQDSALLQLHKHQLAIWRPLQTVTKVTSIGCGPACDGVGMAAWSSSSSSLGDTHSESKKLESLVFLDWAMPQWEAIVRPVVDIMIPSLVETASMGSCDVTTSELTEDNAQAIQQCAEADLVMTSYLLSETRDKWQGFYDGIVARCEESHDPGTLFYLSDPTAWQLHMWLDRYKDRLHAWCWLDSSIDRPEMQVLEGRVGPAVVLALTKNFSMSDNHS